MSLYFQPVEGKATYDLSSLASLCRSIIESFCVLHYVSEVPKSEDERCFREALWEFHSIHQGATMLRDGVPGLAAMPKMMAKLEEAENELKACSVFQALTEGHQKEILKGKKFKLIENLDICKNAGVSEGYYKWLYRLFSVYTHTAPFCITQLDGFEPSKPRALELFDLLHGMATVWTSMAILEFLELFPDQKQALTPDIYATLCVQKGMAGAWDDLARQPRSFGDC